MGSESSYTLKDLKPQTGYYVRVCGVRMCGDKEVVAGAYSSPTLFNTPKIEEVETPVGPTCTAKVIIVLYIVQIIYVVHHFTKPNLHVYYNWVEIEQVSLRNLDKAKVRTKFCVNLFSLFLLLLSTQ